VNTKRDFHAPKGFFGPACSPLVEGEAVLMIIGGEEWLRYCGIQNKATGKVLWKATDDEASYASPVTTDASQPAGRLCF